jgi:hypothetical protein
VVFCLLCIFVKMGDNGDSSAAASAPATATTDLGSDTTSSAETIAPTITSTSGPATTDGGTITTPTALPNAGESTCLFPGGIAVPIQNASSWQTTGCSLGFLCKSGSECRFWGWNIQFTG